ncbi:hypothetical protein CKAN_02775800 [Cinnamomum micranthum f. kanehirae]|uniref:Uncharacterized protein n=1 Tax=Cinnamomum micranthum f. kanehirae TaxID=337451 RepID=A0A3S3N988_9MAGN|nr:hypothetical protein CKAN_02775800 [Cinnamomum micranthum f. kanehirae]
MNRNRFLQQKLTMSSTKIFKTKPAFTLLKTFLISTLQSSHPTASNGPPTKRREANPAVRSPPPPFKTPLSYSSSSKPLFCFSVSGISPDDPPRSRVPSAISVGKSPLDLRSFQK